MKSGLEVIIRPDALVMTCGRGRIVEESRQEHASEPAELPRSVHRLDRWLERHAAPAGGLEVNDRTLLIYLGVSVGTTLALFFIAQAIFRHYARSFADEI